MFMKKTIKSVNPYTLEVNWEFELLSDKEIDEKIDLAQKAFLNWKDISKKRKKELFLKLADIIEEDIDNLAKLQTIEMWMLYKNSKLWLKGTANFIRWFANNFEEILKEREFDKQGIKWKFIYDPLWVIFWVAPWNFPYSQVLRAAIPNILAWNTQVYKHASNVPMCALKLEELFLKAGFPKWVYQNLFVSSSKSEYIISKKEIKWVNLTGWLIAWSSLWWLAWKYLKPSVMELWGNDAFIVCDTNNLDEIVKHAVNARVSNWWQKCNSSKRFIVQEKYYDEFCEKYKTEMDKLLIWDPMDEKTQIQPIAKKELLEELEKQISETIEQWAKLLTWWKRVNTKWYFLKPTVLKDVTENMTSYKQEVFWPVASIIKAKDLNDAINIANNSDFWLCACVYWDNKDELRWVASKIEAGMIFINNPAKSKVFLPFWWVKNSWYWKENWPEWLKAFTNKKVIVY